MEREGMKTEVKKNREDKWRGSKKIQTKGKRKDEADIKANLISVTSPIARGLIGKMEGDEVMISTPGGDTDFEISAVEYI